MSQRDPIPASREEEAFLKALYDALKIDQQNAALGVADPQSGVAVGMLDLRRSAIFLQVEANWRQWVRTDATARAAKGGRVTRYTVEWAEAQLSATGLLEHVSLDLERPIEVPDGRTYLIQNCNVTGSQIKIEPRPPRSWEERMDDLATEIAWQVAKDG